MTKTHVLEDVMSILQQAGWDHSHLPSSCFDILSRGDTQAALLKVNTNVDSIRREGSDEMKRAARYLSASPLIVGERNSRGDLEKHVIYERYGIPTINPETLETYLGLQEQLYVMNRKGGYYVSINAEKFEEKRKENGFSINGLAKEVGVTSRTITKYRKNGVATVETAKRLTNVLGDVVEEVDPLERREISDHKRTDSRPDIQQDKVTQRFIKIGMEASGFKRAPFDVAAKDDTDRFIAKKAHDEEPMVGLLRAIHDLSNSTPFVITQHNTSYDGIGAISERRLQNLQDKDEFKEEIL